MAQYRIRGPHGALALVTVPGPGLDQRTFDQRVEAGEYTILEDEKPEAPPTGGAGSGRSAWVAYAESLGVEVDEEDTRDDIIDKVGG